MQLNRGFIKCGVVLWAVCTFVSPLSMAQTTDDQGKVPYDTPLVRYGDKEFSLGYFYMYAMDYLGRLEQLPPEEKKQALEETLSRVIYEHAVVDLALEQGFDHTEEFIRRSRDMENEWLAKFYTYHQFTVPFEVPEEELKERYEQEKEKFYTPLRFSFRHIFFRTIDLPEEQQKKAKEEAEKAMALIKSGSDFVQVAKLFSDSEKKGTVVGPFKSRKDDPEQAINPLLEDTLLKMEAGDVSNIIQTKYGYEILKLEMLNPAQYKSYEEVKRTLSEQMRREKYQQWRENLLETNWDEAVTEFHPDMIFEDNAYPDAQIASMYGYSQNINVDDYSYLKGREIRRQEGETDEEYQERVIEHFKENIIFDIIAAKLARKLDYDTIPRYIEITKSIQNKKCYNAWWGKLVSQYLEDHPPTEEEKREFYEEYSRSFLKPQKAHVAEMTFKIPPHDEETMYEVFKAEQAATKKAEEAIRRVKAGESFAEVAKEMSENSTAQEGGDIGLIETKTEKLPRMVAREAVGLEPNSVCEKPIKAGDSFYVVYTYEKPERETMEFEDAIVQSRIERGIQNQKSSKLYQEYKDKLLDPEKIELLYDDFYTFEIRNLGQASLEVPNKE